MSNNNNNDNNNNNSRVAVFSEANEDTDNNTGDFEIASKCNSLEHVDAEDDQNVLRWTSLHVNLDNAFSIYADVIAEKLAEAKQHKNYSVLSQVVSDIQLFKDSLDEIIQTHQRIFEQLSTS